MKHLLRRTHLIPCTYEKVDFCYKNNFRVIILSLEIVKEQFHDAVIFLHNEFSEFF